MFKTIEIADFTGGNNSRDNQLYAQDNQCVASSRNVWASGGSLTKVPGLDSYTTMTFVDQNALVTGLGVQRISRMALTELATATGAFRTMLGCRIADTMTTYKTYIFYTDNLLTGYGLGYTTGTITVNTNAALFTATGSGTLWTNHITTGDALVVSGQGTATVGTIQQVVDDTHIICSSIGTTYPTSATGARYSILKGLKDNWPIQFAVLGSACYASDGASTAMVKYNTVGLTSVTASSANEMPVPTFLTAHKNYMFGARMGTGTASASSIRWSVVSDPDNWPINNYTTVDRSTNGIIAGLFSIGHELLIFKTRGLYKLIGDIFDPSNPTYSLVQIKTPNTFGFRQPFSIVEYKGRVVFEADDGFYAYSPGTVVIEKISDIVREDNMFLQVPTTQLPFPQLVTDFSFAAVWKDKIWTSYQRVTNNGEAQNWIIDENLKFWRYVNTTAASENGPNITGVIPFNLIVIPGVVVAGNKEFRQGLYGMYNTDPWVIQVDSTASNHKGTGTAYYIPSEWISKEFNIGYGTFKWMNVYLKKQSGTSNLTVGWQIDQAAKVVSTIDQTIGRGKVIRRTVLINNPGSTIQFYISNSATGQSFDVYKLECVYEPDPFKQIP